MWFSMNKAAAALAVAGGLYLPARGQPQPLDPQSSVKIDFAPDTPLTLVQADLGQSRATARGGALVIDLRMSLTLKNSSPRRVRGVTMLVAAQEVTPGGRASVAVPSLDVAPGATFPVRIDLRLLRSAVSRSLVLWTEPPRIAARADGLGGGGGPRPQVLPGGLARQGA
jgi:FtsP/CotA-like multicopper oxidase with cupredoxin domain